MNIGVYGDSFAHNWPLEKGTWWTKLVTKYGHQVHSYGVGGSNIGYSAALLEKHWQEYDLNIWCLTNPGRISVQLNGDQWLHQLTWLVNRSPKQLSKFLRYDKDRIKRVEVCRDYLKYLYNYEEDYLAGRSLAHFHLAKGNVMIIPCFKDPLKDYASLWDACDIENQYYFPGQDMKQLLEIWEDRRFSHFTPVNHEILGDMVNEKLVPGIFEIDLSRIQKPDSKFEDAFRKWE